MPPSVAPSQLRDQPSWRATAADRWRPLGYAAAGWTAFAIVRWVLSIIVSDFDGAGPVLAYYLAHVAGWTGLTALIWWWLRRIDRWSESNRLAPLGHLVALVVVALIDGVMRRVLLRAIHQPFRRSFGAMVLFSADIVIVSYVAVIAMARAMDAQRARVRQERRELALRAQVAQANLANLEAQLHPHFLFNSLGTIAELAHEDPSAASRMLGELAAVLRFAVSERREVVALREELAALEPYLDIQRVRFVDWLTIEQDVATKALDVRVPRLTLQPLVENAVRHGLVGRSDAARIRIGGRIEDGRLILCVSDNGVGLASSRRTSGFGLGLANLDERLRSLYGSDYSLTIAPSGDAGTVASVSVPVATPLTDSTWDDGVSDAPMPPQGRLGRLISEHGGVALAVGWLVWGTIWMQQSIAILAADGELRSISVGRFLVRHVVAVLIWAAMTPLALRLARAVPVSRPVIGPVVHVIGACAFALLHTALWQVLTGQIERLWSPQYLTTMIWSVLLYAFLLGFAYQRAITDWLRGRDTATARLRAELAEARLSATTIRFRPREVLDVLDSLASRIATDPSGTDDALAELGDRLRADLEAAVGTERSDRSPGVRR